MTANQIAYAKHLEESRHNRVSERHEHADVQTRRMGAETNWFAAQAKASNDSRVTDESIRHNRATEDYNRWQTQFTTAELTRHNQAMENVQYLNALESQRHNQEQERTQFYSANALREFQLNQSEALLRQAYTSERMAAAAELNAKFSGQQASASLKQAEASLRNAAVNETNARTRQNELAASIAMNSAQVGLGYSQLAESKRAHMQAEITQARNVTGTLSETRRHNEAMESINSSQAGTARMNAHTNQRNASTNSYNAKTQRGNAVTNAIGTAVNAVKVGAGFVALGG